MSEDEVVVRVCNNRGQALISITAVFYEDELVVDQSRGRFILIFGPLELALPSRTARKVMEMLRFVMENEKVWV